MNEKAVLRRCRNGDEDAFNELIRYYYPYVSNYIKKLTHDEYLCEDLVQETFFKMIRGFDKYDTARGASFGTYIISIAKNTYIDHLRKERGGCVPIYDTDVTDEGIEDEVLTRLEYEDVIKKMEELTEAQREVLRLKYIDSLTLREIEEITGIEQKTIKSRLHEGRKRLRKLMGKGRNK